MLNGTIIMDTYKEEDIIQTIKTSLLSMYSAMSLCIYYNNNKSSIKQNIKDIQISEYTLARPVQEYALDNVSLERFAISSSLRGVFSAMYEGLKNNANFKSKIESKLSNNYEDFFALINLLRNFYSHELTWMNDGKIILKINDFRSFISYRKRNNLAEILSINIEYKDIFPQKIRIPDNNGIKFELDTNNLKEGVELGSIFSIDIQFKLAELCYDLCNIIKES